MDQDQQRLAFGGLASTLALMSMGMVAGYFEVPGAMEAVFAAAGAFGVFSIALSTQIKRQ